MKRIEIVTFVCTLALVVGGTMLTAGYDQLTPQQARATLAQTPTAAVPAGAAVMTSGGIVATPGILKVNGCSICAVPARDAFQSGEDVIIEVEAKNNTAGDRKVEFCVVAQTYRYYEGGRMPEPVKRLKTVSNNWVTLELAPGEVKKTTITVKGLKAEPDADNSYLVSAMGKPPVTKAVVAKQQQRKSATSINLTNMTYLCGFKMTEPPKGSADGATISAGNANGAH